MVNVAARRFNAGRVAMDHSDFWLSPFRARAAYAGGMLGIDQTPEEKIAELAVPESEPRRAARALYWKGWRISSIARHLGIKRSTINSWKARDEWDKAQAIEHVEASAELRLVKLIEKEVKSGSDYKEIDLLARTIVQMARVRRYEQPGGNEVDLNPKLANRNAGPKKKPTRNDFSDEQRIQLLDAFQDSLFDYQKVWYRNGDQRTRAILKSRQIGATWYFAREALADAMATGRNQIFLSASKSQAHVFKQYIVQFAREAAGIDLTGDPIVLPNGAHLYFLGTNARTAQGYHGNFYFDEFFWTQNFQELNKVASGMAIHKKWRKTYFSTPSSTTHQAYLSRDAFKRLALDFLTFGNCYLEDRPSRSGRPLTFAHALAKYMRRGIDWDTYFFVTNHGTAHQFETGRVFHLMEPDVNQELYGVPQYLSALQSAWLNEAATLFRRKYYKNGSHAGFVFYMTDAAANTQDVDNLRQAMRDSKGPGNFRNLFMYAPNGKKDGIQILPVSDVAAKDEFFNIKSVTRDDQLAAHRVPPQLMGILPNNAGGFGAVEPAARVFARNELVPLQSQFLAINEWAGVEVVKFAPYELAAGEGAA